MQVNSEFS